jgi:hypothetical protein
MDPGWSTIPNMRLLYTAYNVSSKLRPGDNVLGVRLGFCHYGYIDQAFCISGHAERDTCRAFLMVLSLTYEDELCGHHGREPDDVLAPVPRRDNRREDGGGRLGQ